MPARNAKTGKKGHEGPVSSPMLKVRSLCLLACLVLGTVAPCFSLHSAAPQSAEQSKPQSAAQTAPEKPPEKQAEKHSTPEDRQRLVAIAHKLEAAPRDPTLGPDREWAVKWIFSSPDVHVHLCTALLSDLRRPRYKYKSELGSQLLIAIAAFLIEHPEKSTDNVAKSVAGMESVLKAYTAILKTDPQATASSLDEYLQEQKTGKLADAVREKIQDCH
jgi:hypothetical protein